MTLERWRCEGVPGGNVTQSNFTSDTGRTATALGNTAGSTITYSTAQVYEGATSVEFVAQAGVTQSLRLPFAAADDEAGARWPWYFPALPSTAMCFATLRHASGQNARIYLTTDGKVQARTTAAVLIAETAPGAIPAGAWREVALVANRTTGAMTLNVYDDEENLTGTLSFTGGSIGTADYEAVDFGNPAGNPTGAAFTHYLDVAQLDDGASTEPPIHSVNTAPTANAGTDQSVDSYATVTLNGGGSTDAEGAVTYAWTQTGGTPVTLDDPTAAQPTFTAPAEMAGATLTFQLQVSDGTLTDTDTTTVTVNPHNEWVSTGAGLMPARVSVVT